MMYGQPNRPKAAYSAEKALLSVQHLFSLTDSELAEVRKRVRALE
jgi:hypothetical protein